MHHPESVPENKRYKCLLDFMIKQITNSGQKTRLSDS